MTLSDFFFRFEHIILLLMMFTGEQPQIYANDFSVVILSSMTRRKRKLLWIKSLSGKKGCLHF
jgi:hypothetical protein